MRRAPEKLRDLEATRIPGRANQVRVGRPVVGQPVASTGRRPAVDLELSAAGQVEPPADVAGARSCLGFSRYQRPRLPIPHRGVSVAPVDWAGRVAFYCARAVDQRPAVGFPTEPALAALVDLHAGCFADGVAGLELAAVLVRFPHDSVRAPVPRQNLRTRAHTPIRTSARLLRLYVP
jgi:hypothetical protein